MDNEGEGLITPIDRNADVKPKPDNRVPIKESFAKAYAPKKFLGIPTWTWLVAGAILVFAVFAVLIVMASR